MVNNKTMSWIGAVAAASSTAAILDEEEEDDSSKNDKHLKRKRKLRLYSIFIALGIIGLTVVM